MVVNVWWGGPLCLVLAHVVAVYCILYTVRKPISFLRGHHPPCDDGEREDDGGRKDGDDGDGRATKMIMAMMDMMDIMHFAMQAKKMAPSLWLNLKFLQALKMNFSLNGLHEL